MKKYLQILSLIVLVTLSFCSSSKEDTENKKEINTDPYNSVTKKSIDAAPDFSLITVDGVETTLAQFRGKVVLLNFWATWCPPCKAEIPDFIRLYDEHNEKGLEIIGIAVNSGSAEDIRNFIDKYDINYTILTGDEKYMYELAQKYGNIRSIPTTFLIDKDGVIRQQWVGQRTEEVLMAEINKYL